MMCFDSLLYWVYIAVLFAHGCIVCRLLYCVYYACIGCTMYLRFILCICCLYYCLYLTPDYSLLRCRTTGLKSVTGRSCDRPSRHRFFLVFLGPRANAGMVPVFCSKLPLHSSRVAPPPTKSRANSPCICNMLNDRCHRVFTHLQLIIIIIIIMYFDQTFGAVHC